MVRLRPVLALVALVASFAVATSADAATTDVYAAPNGSGSACSANRPCSITQAKTTVVARHGGRVLLAGGTYRLSAPLVFGPQDSGTPGRPIVWQALPGATPVISGGTSITGWHQGAGGLWSAPVPTGLSTRQLYADGTRLLRSSGSSPVALTQTATGFVAADDTMASWRNPSSIEFVFDGGHGAWTQPRCDVASISGKTITMRQPCWSNLDLPSTPLAPDGDNPSGGFPSLDTSATPTRIENAYELLSPGTWYLDQAAHTVYYDARPTDDVASMQFVAPVLPQLLTTSSTADNPLHDVTFIGITFAYAPWLQPSGNDGLVEMQATMNVTGEGGSTSQGLCQYVVPAGTCPFAGWSRPPAAVDLVGTRNVSVLGSTFAHLGGAGLGAYHGASGDLFSGNEIHDVSGNGIEFGTTDDPQPTALATDLARGARTSHTSTRWQVDLGEVKPLWQTVLTARGPLSDYWVFVSATPFDTRLTAQQQVAQPGVWSSHQSGALTVPTDTAGRYVMIQVAGSQVLDLDSVAVKSGAEIAIGNTISDNYVHDIGAEYTGAVGIWGGYSRKTTITHNEVGDLPYSGISFGWAGWHTNADTPFTNPNVMADNVISDNVIYNVMGIRTDGGPIYTNGPQGQSIEHGLLLKGNVTYGSKATSFANYNDEGSAYILMDGNVQYADSGNFNGGCSTTGHIIVKNSYRVGPLNVYICDHVGTDFVDGGGNTLIAQNPGPGVIPSGALAAAGLEAAYSGLATSHRPEVSAVSPIHSHEVLVSGTGFTAASAVRIDGTAATSVSYIGSNQLAATLPANAYQGDVTVTTASGTSVVTSNSYTYDASLNVAQGKAASESSTAFDSPAAHAVDGNTAGSYGAGSLSHTDLDQQAWWQVDLGSAQSLSSINLWNRTDCCAERDTDYWVFVSSTPFDHSLTPEQQAAQPGVWSSHQPGTIGRPTKIPASTTGQYVMVQLAGTNYLSLSEVQVFRAP